MRNKMTMLGLAVAAAVALACGSGGGSDSASGSGNGAKGGDEKPADGESGQGGHESYDPVGPVGFRHQDTPGCASRVSASHACAACDR